MWRKRRAWRIEPLFAARRAFSDCRLTPSRLLILQQRLPSSVLLSSKRQLQGFLHVLKPIEKVTSNWLTLIFETPSMGSQEADSTVMPKYRESERESMRRIQACTYDEWTE